MAALSSINLNAGLGRDITGIRVQLADLQRQMATGRKAASFGALGGSRIQSLSLRHELGSIDAYRRTITQVNTRVEVLRQTLERMRSIVATTASDAYGTGFELDSGGQTLFQREAYARFTEMVALLNSDVAGRYLFGGRETGRPPIAPSQHILDGVNGKAGFKQVAAERKTADLGADGLGRLVLGLNNEEVTLAEDIDGSPFGFKLNTVTSTLTGTAVTGPAGAPPEITVTFSATLPQDGETLRLDLSLPDGTSTTVILTARSTGPLAAGEFLIGADENATAANFSAALNGALQQAAATDLTAASLNAAANDFFDSNPPQRVDGPPFDTAIALRNGTETDTVFWYRGDTGSGPARESAVAKIDDHVIVAYGARADEDSFRNPFKQLAILATATFSGTDPNAGELYAAIKDRTKEVLTISQGAQAVDDVLTEIVNVFANLGKTDERLVAKGDMLRGILDGIEEADVYQVSAEILALQTRLEASLAVTSMLSNLSLVNYL